MRKNMKWDGTTLTLDGRPIGQETTRPSDPASPRLPLSYFRVSNGIKVYTGSGMSYGFREGEEKEVSITLTPDERKIVGLE